MRRAVRVLAGLVSFLVLCLFVLGGALAVMFGTQSGQDFVRDQTTTALNRLLGPSYDASLGDQTFGLREDGLLAISWTGVRLQRRDEIDRAGEVRRVSVALRLLPLVGGRLEFGRLEIDGARIDLTAFGEAAPARARTSQDPTAGSAMPRSAIGRSAESAIRTIERQLQALQAFHFDTVEFRDIVVEGVPNIGGGELRLREAELHRGLDGSLQLSTDLDVANLPLHLAGDATFGDDDGRLEAMTLRSSPVELGSLLPPARESDVYDERPFGSDAAVSLEVSLRRDAAGDVPVLAAVFRSGPGAVQLGLNHTRVESADLRLEYRGGEDRLVIGPSPMRFRDVAFDLSGDVAPVLDVGATGASDRLAFRLGTDEILSRVGVGNSAEPRRASLWAAGEVDTIRRAAALQSIDLRTASGTLQGEASYASDSPASLTTLNLTGQTLAASDIKAFWPFLLSGRARDWVLRHIGDGTVPTAAIGLEVRRDRLNVAFKPDNQPSERELHLDIAFDGADSATVGALPRVTAASGTVTVRGSTTVVDIADARLDGVPDVAIAPSRITMTKPTDGDRRDLMLALALEAGGPLAPLLEISNREPIHALRSVELDPSRAIGQARVRVGATLRLGRAVARDDQLRDWSVEADLQDAAPGQTVQGQEIAHLTGPVRVRPGQLTAELKGEVSLVPATISATLPFGDKAVGERRVEVALDVPAKRVVDLVPALADVVDGPLRAKVDVGEGVVSADVDLRDTGIDLPSIAWTKGKGVPASLDFVLQREGEVTQLRDIVLTGEGFSAKGRASIDGSGLRSAELSDVALNPNDDVSVNVERQRSGFAVRVEGSRFDARPILAELRESVGRDDDRRPGGGTFDISADVERLTGFNNQSVANFTLNYASAKGRMAALAFGGTTRGGTLRGDLSPRPNGRSIRISSNDTGSLLAFSGLYDHMEAGQGVLELVGDPDSGYQGSVQLRNFTLVDEPRLSRIVGSSPQSGTQSLSQAVGRELRTERAFFDQASARLAYGERRLQVADGIVRGPVFGSSFAGTLYDPRGLIDITGSFMPAYGINRIFGAIPVLGQILGNGNEGGLIGITYRLSGAFASPTLIVNPISAIAPGIFRSIFAFQ